MGESLFTFDASLADPYNYLMKPRASASGNFYVNSSDLELYKLYFSHFGATLWNEIPCHIRHLPTINLKNTHTLRKLLFDIFNSEDIYIHTPTLIKQVKLAKNIAKIIFTY